MLTFCAAAYLKLDIIIVHSPVWKIILPAGMGPTNETISLSFRNSLLWLGFGFVLPSNDEVDNDHFSD